MIHVVLDTSIYRSNPDRDNLHFKAVEKLSSAGLLRLHIPYVVLREFQTQQRAIYSKDLTKAISGLHGLSRKRLSKKVSKDLKSKLNEIKKNSENILHDAEIQIIEWADKIKADIYPICVEQAHSAFEAYFQGTPPLKSIKNREDIPDSFVVQSIYKLNVEHGCVHVVANDGKIRDSFSDLQEIHTYETLSEFIESNLIQDELKETDLIGNIGPIVDALEEFENNSTEISSYISNNIGESIVWQPFHDPSIRDDNHEATITGYYDAENVELNFEDINYYGNGQFGLPFSLSIRVLADYYIFKSDYYCLDPDRDNVPSVTDHNDHYFEAQEEFDLCVYGLISITIDKSNIILDKIESSIVEDSYTIDEITGLELC